MHLIYSGAEAELYKSQYLGMDCVEKIRIPKSYRIKEIDNALRVQRTKTETYNILRASKFLNVPKIFDVDISTAKITMQFISGKKLKDFFLSASSRETATVAREIGAAVLEMHKNNMVHGDLTTSNMILSKDKVFFIDFGLAKFSLKVEDKAMDISVFKKMLLSTHYKNFDVIWNNFLKIYTAKDVLSQMRKIELRGRYVDR